MTGPSSIFFLDQPWVLEFTSNGSDGWIFRSNGVEVRRIIDRNRSHPHMIARTWEQESKR